MKAFMSCLLTIVILCGCSIEESITRNDQHYLQPGALDLPLTNVYDTYQYKFLDKYLITHQWPHTAGTCSYRAVRRGNDALGGRVFAGRDIYESDGKTWQRFEGMKPFDFDRYVRSVKVMNPVYGEVNGGRQKTGEEEIETGLQTMCHQSWYATQHGLTMLLRKWSVDQYLTWLKKNSQQQGRVSHQRIGTNDWTVLEFDLEPQSTDGASSGPYQFWMLPIGKTGYTFLFRLGANLESLKYSAAHERFKATFRHLIESVNIEPLQP